MGNKYTKREFTAAEIATIGEEYTRDTDPLSVQALREKYKVGTDRMYALIRESGHEVRSSGEQLQAWHAARKRTKAAKATAQTPKAKGTEAGSPAQLNNGYEFSTDKTRKPPTRRIVADVPCGWDGVTRNVIRVARGERTCMLCGEAVTGRECPTSGCDGGELVDTVTALGLRDGEWVRA